MAMVFAHYGDSQTDVELVAGVTDSIISVLRIVATTEGQGSVKFISAPGRPEATDVTPELYLSSAARIDLPLSRAAGLAAARGKSLGVTTSFSGQNKKHSIIVWYELVK